MIYTRFRQSKLWAQVLESARNIHREVSYVEITGGKMNRGICDLVVEDKNNEVWIYDFKTSPDLSAENVGQYREQMTSYRLGLESSFPGKSIRTAIIAVPQCELYELG